MDDKKLGIAGRITKATIQSPMTLLMLLVAFAVGIMALLAIPREEEPQISVPMVTIQIPAPGLSAGEVESLVTKSVELALRGLDKVEHVYSQSQDDGVMLTTRFVVGTDAEDAVVRIQQKLREPNVLPDHGILEPIVAAKGIDDVPIMVVTISPDAAVADRWSNAALFDLASDIKSELTKVENVGSSFMVGGKPDKVQIIPDAARLKSLNVPLGALIDAVRTSAAQVPLGSVKTNGQAASLSLGNSYKDLANIGSLDVPSLGGNSVLVSDVADIVMSPDNENIAAFHYVRNGENWSRVPTIAIAIAKRPGVNAVKLTSAVHERLEALHGNLIPEGIRAEIVRDYGHTANEKANELLFHLALATLSIVALIFFAIGKRESLVTLVVIPTTILLTMFAANFMGYTINRVSLFALIFSIGILVDDAIVIIENIARHWAMHPKRSRIDGAIAAVAEVGNPTIVATLTVVVALLPMMFVSGLMGPYMAPIPANASAAMIFSFFVAVIIAPWLMVKFAPKNQSHAHAHDPEAEGKLGQLYRKIAAPIIKTRKSAWQFLLIVGIATIAACFLFYTKTITVKLLPFDNKSEFQIVADMPEGTSIESTQRALFEAAALVGQIEEVESMEAYAGTSAPFNFNGLVRHFFLRTRPEMGDLQINLKPKDDRKRASHEIALQARAMLRNIPVPKGGSLIVVEVPPGPPVISTLLAEVYHKDGATRRQIADNLKALMAKIPYIVDIDDYYGTPRPKTVLIPNRAAMTSLGVNEGQVLQSISAAMNGISVGSLNRGNGREPLNIEISLPQENRDWNGALSTMPVAISQSATGARLVEIGEIVQANETQQNYPIFRRDGLQAEMVVADLAGKYEAPIYGIFDTNKAIANHNWGALPTPKISWHGQPKDENAATILWDGEWEITYVTFRDMGAAFGVAIIGIYILVVAQFGSFKLPLVVLTPIPLTLIGIVFGHAIFGAPFTATSMIGFIALAGIIVRNSILLVDFIRNAKTPDKSLREVLLEAGAIRFKPIMLTALAAMIGAIVILGDPIFQGLAISLLFGLMSSTLLTVLVIPAIYVALRDDEAKRA